MPQPAAQPAGPTGGPATPRDRVLDAVKATAVVAVIAGHTMAWDISTGTPGSALDRRPDLLWLTWLVQVLPLFFIVGGAANLGSWRRRPDREAFLRRRILRLGTPVLTFAAVWTAVCLPLAALTPWGTLAGDFLATLTWFMGAYAAVVASVPWTARWTARPGLALGAWLALIVAVDALRFTVAPEVGWLNVALVWGWVHQVGYHLPALRRRTPAALAALAAAAFAAAIGLAVPGPYSSSLLTYGPDPQGSNFTPPTAVLALYALAQALTLAAGYRVLERALARERIWRAVGAVASRAVHLYLWHIPWVAAVAAFAWAVHFRPALLDGAWWLAHAAGLAVVAVGTWTTARVTARADPAVATWLAGRGRRRRRCPAGPAAALATAALLLSSVTGYGTWWGPIFLGMPFSSLLSLMLLVVALRAVGATGVGDGDRHSTAARARGVTDR